MLTHSLKLSCPTSTTAWQTSRRLKTPSLTHTHQSAIIKVRQSSTQPVSQSLSHLRVGLQVRSSLSRGRYQPPTRSWCSPSTSHSELSNRSAKRRDLHPSQGWDYYLFIYLAKKKKKTSLDRLIISETFWMCLCVSEHTIWVKLPFVANANFLPGCYRNFWEVPAPPRTLSPLQGLSGLRQQWPRRMPTWSGDRTQNNNFTIKQWLHKLAILS